MLCDRCVLKCGKVSACGVVDVDRKVDLYPWMPVYMSVVPVEEVPIYHACPGGLAARIVIPGAPWRCRVCFWSEYAEPKSLVLRRLEPSELERLKIVKPSLLLVDGGEPLIHDWALSLPEAVGRIVGSIEVYGFRTTGLLSLDRLEEARAKGFSLVIFEYTLAVERPPRPDHIAETLKKAYELFDILEIHFLHDGSRKADIMLSSLASAYTEAAVHVIPLSEEAEEHAYNTVEKLRDKGAVFTYLYHDESYTLTDTVCPGCGAMLVSRRPWGVKVDASVSQGFIRCSKCGRRLRVRVCRGAERRRAIHRETVLW